jgi:hypothetical protein
MEFIGEDVENFISIEKICERIMRGDLLKHFLGIKKLILEADDSFPRLKACFQFMCIKGFGDVIINSRGKTFPDVNLFASYGQHDEIDVSIPFLSPDLFTQFDTIHLGH